MNDLQRAYYRTILRHHGVKGQKWGVRNGPPYPLGSSKRRTGKNSLDKPGVRKHTGVSSSKGSHVLSKSEKLDKYIDVGKGEVDRLLRKKAGDIEFGQQKVSDLPGQSKPNKTVGGLKRLAKPESLEETLRNVNPNYGDPKYKNNCSACGIATSLRQRGFDVVAKSTGGEMRILGGVVEECFKGAKITDGSAVKFGRSRQDASEMLLNRFGDNASGVVSVQWKKAYAPNGGGHVFNWQIKDGVVSFFDGQTNKNDSVVSGHWERINPNDSLTIARIDNAEINFEDVKKYVENR